VVDITDRKSAEAALREREEQLRLALEAAHMGTWDWDLVAGTVAISEHVEAMFGLPRGGSPYRMETLWPLIHPEDRQGLERTIASAQAGSFPGKAEFRVPRPDGGCLWLEGRGNARCDEEGRPLRLLGTVMDVTERKQLELQVQQAQKLESLGVLAG